MVPDESNLVTDAQPSSEDVESTAVSLFQAFTADRRDRALVNYATLPEGVKQVYRRLAYQALVHFARMSEATGSAIEKSIPPSGSDADPIEQRAREVIDDLMNHRVHRRTVKDIKRAAESAEQVAERDAAVHRAIR